MQFSVHGCISIIIDKNNKLLLSKCENQGQVCYVGYHFFVNINNSYFDAKMHPHTQHILKSFSPKTRIKSSQLRRRQSDS